ncbi:ESPR-type extended signal peptide-containing protein [Phascolarctobacterium succinatutens]|uniref:ESPR-type extended signal peptide-containing protein n=1 Tax=Phascolarctobacterium succinatutens TaxID=626940 RepID=UPI0026E9E658|nr:ESPR-type extended signal peptide-containing protein [Phascolarctobacterium succinatutens]
MNKVFKVIWSEARNAYVVVSEMAKNHGAKSCSTKKLLAMLIATGVMTCASMAPAMADNPASDDANKGWNLSVNNGITAGTEVQPGGYVNFNGDGENIIVSATKEFFGPSVKVELSRNLNVDSIHAGDFFMNNEMGIGFGGDAYITTSGLNANNNVITNVAAGVADTDAVNVGQLKNSAWKLAANGALTEAEDVKAGDFVDFSGDKNISVKHDGTKVQVELNKNIDVNYVQTNALNAKYNLSVGTANENGIMPFFVNSNGAFYGANNNFSVDKDGKVTATAAEIGNVVLNNGVFTGHSALRDGELFVGDASGNYS